jgi:hypothetical protein
VTAAPDWDWELYPHEGAGPLRFGMTPEAVHAVLSEPLVARPRRPAMAAKASRQEMYPPALGLTYQQDDTGLALVAIGFGKAMAAVSYAGAKLFATRPDAVLRLFAAKDPEPRQIAGAIVFLRLGVGLTGFHDGATDDLAVNISAAGQWDGRSDPAKPFAVP